MFLEAALNVFLISNPDSVDANILALPCHLVHAGVAAGDLVLDGVHLVVL